MDSKSQDPVSLPVVHTFRDGNLYLQWRAIHSLLRQRVRYAILVLVPRCFCDDHLDDESDSIFRCRHTLYIPFMHI